MAKRLVEIASEIMVAQASAGGVPAENMDETLLRIFSVLQRMQEAEMGGRMRDLRVPCPVVVTTPCGTETTVSAEGNGDANGSESERERVPGAMEEDSSPQHKRTIALPWAEFEEKPVARRLCPYCEKEEAVRVKRQSWMRLLPGSKLYRCDFCYTKFLNVNGCVLKVPRLHIL